MTEEDIKTITKDLTEEQMKQLMKILTEKDLNALELKLDKAVKNNFLFPLQKSNITNIELLYKDSTIRIETINLLNQSLKSISNIHYLIENKSLVDANVLLRACFENIIMAMMIYFDENTYNEFKILGLTEEKREYTSLSKLRNNFKKKLKIISPELFNDFNNRKIGHLLKEFYDKLCLYTHSTVVVNAMVEVSLNNDEDLFISIIKINLYLLEILIYVCLKYLSKDNENKIDFTYAIFGMFLMLSRIDKDKYSEDYLKKYNDLLYPEINSEYFKINSQDIKEIQKMAKEINSKIEDNPIGVISILTKLLKE
jgi:hypothetical protein